MPYRSYRCIGACGVVYPFPSDAKVGRAMSEQEYLIAFSGEKEESLPIEESTFRILGLTADEWNALPPNARYYLIADAEKRSLRQEPSEQE